MPSPSFCPAPVPNFPAASPAPRSARVTRFNRKARAMAEAEGLGVDLRDPFGLIWGDCDPLADSGRRKFGPLI